MGILQAHWSFSVVNRKESFFSYFEKYFESVSNWKCSVVLNFNPTIIPSGIQYLDHKIVILCIKVCDTNFATAFDQIVKIYLSNNAVLRVLSTATKEFDADSSWDFSDVGLDAFADCFTCIRFTWFSLKVTAKLLEYFMILIQELHLFIIRQKDGLLAKRFFPFPALFVDDSLYP